ncbi:MAG: 16S rRNA (adenine(1518)-N(6)/adenine(1519)-N(6))-dimethyltransferase RsmA [Alphaproteobacteria bacterium]
MIKNHPILKKYGQHFLQDINIAEKIVRLAALPDRARVIEIGPGRGMLSKAILANSNASLLAIEKDKNLAPYLEALLLEFPDRFTLSFQDALAWQLNGEAKTDSPYYQYDMIANLPYNIGSQLLVNFCQQHFFYRQMVLMFQKEVAMRLVAKPSTADFGRLSILVQTIAQVEWLFTLPPSAFFPMPKVESAVVRLVIKQTPLPCDMTALGFLTNILFQQRRKQLHHGLANIIGGDKKRAKYIMAQLAILDKSRAEDLPPAVFWQITNYMLDDINILCNKKS